MPHRIVLDSDPIGDANLEALVKKAESADMYKALWQQTQARLDALEVRFEKEMAAKDAIIADLQDRCDALTQALARSTANPDNSGEPPGGRPQPRRAKRPPPEVKTKKPAGGQSARWR